MGQFLAEDGHIMIHDQFYGNKIRELSSNYLKKHVSWLFGYGREKEIDFTKE